MMVKRICSLSAALCSAVMLWAVHTANNPDGRIGAQGDVINDIPVCDDGMMTAEVGSHKERIVENGGTGEYKAVMKEDDGLPAHTIFVPAELEKFNSKNHLKIILMITK